MTKRRPYVLLSVATGIGLPEHPLKITVTSTGNVDPALEFWH